MYFAETGALSWFASHSWWRSRHEEMAFAQLSFILLFYGNIVLRYVDLVQSRAML